MKKSGIKNFPFCPESNTNAVLVLIAFAMVTSMLLLSNPGYFSHDELQKLDAVDDLGLWKYIQAYVNFPDFDDFAIPVRPFSYLVQGLVAASANNQPFMMHLADVFMHAVVGVLVFMSLLRVTDNRKLAWVAALVFLVCPHTTFAVGWSAALMDRLYTLFGVISCLAAYNYVSRKGGAGTLWLLLVSAALSVSSKETGIVFPAIILGYLFVSVSYLKDRKFWVALGVWGLPSLAMLAYRAKPLLNSIGGMESDYSVDFMGIPANIFVYVAYPFVPSLQESYAWHYLASQSDMVWGFLAHIVLTLLLWRKFSLKVALAYDATYLLFLLPVVTLSATAPHYLYASGIPFSVAIAALLVLKGRKQSRIASAYVVVLLVVAIVHTFKVQDYIYDNGTCSVTTMASATSVYLSLNAPNEMTIVAERGSSAQIPMRIFHDRDRLGEFRPIKINTLNWDHPDAGLHFIKFNTACVVYTTGIGKFSVRNWEPRTTKAGVVVNEQPDGGMGMWIKVVGDHALGEVEVLFNNIPAMVTSRQPGLITAAISAEQISEPGSIEVAIHSQSTGEIIKVGDFIVEPAD
jgi:hypothetical protein